MTGKPPRSGDEVPAMVPSAIERLGRIDGGPDIIAELEEAFRDGYTAANGRAERMLEALREPSDTLIDELWKKTAEYDWRCVGNRTMVRAVIRAVYDMLARVK